jgi:uncharacterized protein
MRALLIAVLCAVFITPCLAQTADTDPATKDDVILLFRTMHSYDLIQKLMEVQSQSTQQLFRDQLEREKGVPSDFEARIKKMNDEMIKGIPADEIVQAMIPAYQKHFTRGDIAAMNAFYSSPVGQKVLRELPAVTQEGMQEMMPILNKYLEGWKERVQHEFEDGDKNAPGAPNPPAQN